MWAVWRSFELAASRRLQRVYLSSAAQARAGGDYYRSTEYDYVPLDQVSQPLLPSSDVGHYDDDDNNAYRHHHRQSSSSSTTNPFPILILPSSAKRRLSFLGPWRSKIRHIAFIVVAVILLVGSPTLLKFLHLYSDPGYDDTFLRPLYTPHPAPIEQLVPPVSLPEVIQKRSKPKSSTSTSETPPTELHLNHDDDDDYSAKRLEALLPALQNELAARLDSLGMPAYMNHTHCSSLSGTATKQRYGHLASSTRGRTLIGLNLYNSQNVLPSIGRALLPLAQFLGPKNVVISIFENGSDDGTRQGLAHLAAVLTAAGIPHRIVSDEAKTQWENVDRISQLALYRNVVLEPLYHHSSPPLNSSTGNDGKAIQEEKPFENVMFINDVYFCPTDALELLHVRATQQAHATCGLDWRWRHNSMPSILGTGPKFYDNWVARSLKGNTLRSRLDIFSELRDGIAELFYVYPDDEEVHMRMSEARPVPVYSCWNGMIALDARPFVGLKNDDAYGIYNPPPPPRHQDADGVKRDLDDETSETIASANANANEEEVGKGAARRWHPLRFRGARRWKQECAASECKLVAKDFWKRGFDRWVLVPYVRTTYEWDLYNQIDLEELAERAKGRWRSPSPALATLPPAPARFGLPPLSSTSSLKPTTPSQPSSTPANKSDPAIVEYKWAFPSAPHPLEPTLFDAYSIPSVFDVELPDDNDEDNSNILDKPISPRSPSYPPPIKPSAADDLSVSPPEDEAVVGLLGGEELDLLAWDRIQGPDTVVCWPYHGVGGRHVEWWWTMVIEKVKKPLRHLRRRS